MSAGAFTFTVYTASYADGAAHPIRVQPETLAATAGGIANAAADGVDANNPISAMVSASKRSLGLHARTVTLELTGTPPTGYKVGSRVRIPCLTEGFYDAVAIKGTPVTYLGTTWRTSYVTPESTK